ncbi:PPOX class F420-dependent oxidoreductase [Actinomadura verrucosospora]|uniref:Pyridoxamine 5'-phosphate oxidase family protein n=1 Tax=Actinomadura verrucosospora TaxID=46165 RepID=A0A7D3VQI4_ACTVE|nr:PPOX class F420-dependent oxidoreductase [Actinomadura verrucosospora]QKG20475.1 pyridoxamine 5'-phosphate oxidase family protein [Actinomadura verrucosospora]
MADDAALVKLLQERDLGVLATLKRDGRPQLSNVNYHFDAGSRLIRVSITADRAKARNLRRDPRASLHASAPDGWSYAVAEGTAELTAVAADPHDAAVDELVAVYREIRGEHPDWDEYRRVMVQDGRLVLKLHVEHLYGMARG